jgi:hypothetical protein
MYAGEEIGLTPDRRSARAALAARGLTGHEHPWYHKIPSRSFQRVEPVTAVVDVCVGGVRW